MTKCAVYNCKNSSYMVCRANGNISFHRFPDDPFLRQQWSIATGLTMWHPSKYTSICSAHFTEKDFKTTFKSINRRLSCGAIPTLGVHKGPVGCQNQIRETISLEGKDVELPHIDKEASQTDLETKKLEFLVRRAENIIIQKDMKIKKLNKAIKKLMSIKKILLDNRTSNGNKKKSQQENNVDTIVNLS